jgi:hypothetical protein
VVLVCISRDNVTFTLRSCKNRVQRLDVTGCIRAKILYPSEVVSTYGCLHPIISRERTPAICRQKGFLSRTLPWFASLDSHPLLIPPNNPADPHIRLWPRPERLHARSANYTDDFAMEKAKYAHLLPPQHLLPSLSQALPIRSVVGLNEEAEDPTLCRHWITLLV